MALTIQIPGTLHSALVRLATKESVLTCHLSLKPEKEIISTFLLLAHVYKSILNDPSAALTLTQNHGTKKGFGGGRKNNKDPQEKGAKSPALWSAVGAEF